MNNVIQKRQLYPTFVLTETNEGLSSKSKPWTPSCGWRTHIVHRGFHFWKYENKEPMKYM